MSNNLDRAHIFGETPTAVERIAPGFFSKALVAGHLARYRWAARYVRGLQVLDVACGTGYGGEILRAGGARSVVSVDINSDALSFGLSRYELRAIRADAECLPFGPANFGAVVSLETIEHLEEPKKLMEESARLLPPGGAFLVSTPNADRSNNTNPYHLNELTLGELLSYGLATGFRALSVRGQHWRLTGPAFRQIRGLRRLSWEIERYPGVWCLPSQVAQPFYWCVRFERVS